LIRFTRLFNSDETFPVVKFFLFFGFSLLLFLQLSFFDCPVTLLALLIRLRPLSIQLILSFGLGGSLLSELVLLLELCLPFLKPQNVLFV